MIFTYSSKQSTPEIVSDFGYLIFKKKALKKTHQVRRLKLKLEKKKRIKIKKNRPEARQEADK